MWSSSGQRRKEKSKKYKPNTEVTPGPENKVGD